MRKHLTLIALVMSGGCIYNLSYFRGSFESTMLDVFQITGQQLSYISALLGSASLICYFPGGWLADRFSSRNLLTFSCLSTGLGGVYMSLIASGDAPTLGSNYHQLLGLHIFWALTTILTYWAALIKATQDWGGAQQGIAFGLLDSGRGLAKVLLTTLSIALFARHMPTALIGDEVARAAATTLEMKRAGLSDAILTHAIACLLSGVACWLWIQPESVDQGPTGDFAKTPPSLDQKSSTVEDLATLAKLPTVWLMALIVFASYSAYWSTFTFATYARDHYQFSEGSAAYLSTISMWVRAVMPLAAGVIADRLGKFNVVTVSFIVCGSSFMLLGGWSGDPEMTWVLLTLILIASLGIFGLRGVYFALLKGSEIPKRLSGLAVGVVSLFGFTPDIIIPLYLDVLKSHFRITPERVDPYYHQVFYLSLLGISLLGAFATLNLARRTRQLTRP